MHPLSRPSLECIASRNGPLVHALLEPLRALRGAAMGKGLRADVPGGHLLQAIVAYRRSGVDGAFRVTFLKEIPLLSGVRPDTSKAVSLQLQLDRQSIALRWFIALQSADFGLNAHQLLHMMADLMGKNVCFSKVTGCAKAALQLIVKAKIDIDFFIHRAVERPCS